MGDHPPLRRDALVSSQRLLVLVRRFVAILSFIALSIARCCRGMAVTAALGHQPATLLAKVNMMLRGDPCPPLAANRNAAEGRDGA